MATNPYENPYKNKITNPYATNPYTGQTTKIATLDKDLTEMSEAEKTKAALTAQRDNLEKRLNATEGADTGSRIANLEKNQGLLGDFFELIDRPTQAVKGLLFEGAEGFVKGLTGEEDYVTSEELGLEDANGFLKFVVDLGADIILDPFNLLTFGASGALKAGKILNATDKTLDAIRGFKAGVGKVESAIMFAPFKLTKGFASAAISAAIDLAGLQRYATKATAVVQSAQKKYVKFLVSAVKSKKMDKFYSKIDEIAKVDGLAKRAADGLLEGAELETFNKARSEAIEHFTSEVGNYEIYDPNGPTGQAVNLFEKSKGDLSKSGIRTPGDAEVAQLMDLENYFSGFGDKFKFGVTGSSNTKFDAAIYAKGEDGLYYKVRTIEVKKMFKIKDRALSKYVDEGLDKEFKAQTKARTKAKKAKNWSEAQEEAYIDLRNRYRDAGYKKAYDAGEAIADTARFKTATIDVGATETQKKIVFVDKVDKTSQDAINKVLEMLPLEERDQLIQRIVNGKSSGKGAVEIERAMFDSDVAYTNFINQFADSSKTLLGDDDFIKIFGGNQDAFARVDDFIAAMKKNPEGVTFTIELTIQGGRKPRLIFGPREYTDEFLADLGNDIESAFIQELPAGYLDDAVEETPIKLAMIDVLADNIEGKNALSRMVKRNAQRLRKTKDLVTVLSYKLNKTKGLTPEFVASLRRVGGKAGVQLEQLNGRLASLVKKLIKETGDEDALRKVYEIIESGAQLTGEGALEYAGRKITFEELIANLELNHADGVALAVLPEFTDDITKQNFLDNINDLYRNGSGAQVDGFRIVEKNGSYLLGIADDASLKEVKKALNSLEDTVRATELSFGKRMLSKDLQDFYGQYGDLIENFKGLQSDTMNILVKELGFTNLPDAMQQNIGYVRHVLSEAASKNMEDLFPAVRSPFVQEGVDMLKRRRYLGTTDEINRAMRAHFGVGNDLFDMNIQSAVEDFVQVTVQKMEGKGFLEEFFKYADENGTDVFKAIENTRGDLNNLGPDFIALPKGKFDVQFKKLLDNLPPDSKDVILKRMNDLMGDLKDPVIAMQRSTFEVLQQVNRAYVEINPFVRGLDKFMNTWKSITLVSPGFHMRNFFGNMTQSFLVGMGIPQQTKYARKAMLDINNFSTIAKRMADLGTDSVDEIIALGEYSDEAVEGYKRFLKFREEGIAQTHKGTRDLDTIKEQLSRGGKKNLPNQIVEMNFNAAEAMDDFQRYMLYQWGYDTTFEKAVKGGLSQADAAVRATAEGAKKVTDSLFDYSHLTSFEREYMKRLFPFYTFMKNNIVFQAKNIFENPKAYRRLGQFQKYATEDLAGLDKESLPDYMQDNMWLPIPIEVRKDDKEAIAFLKLNLPPADFASFVENPFKEGATTVMAPVKLFFEMAGNRDLFTGSPIKEFEGEKNRMEAGTGVLTGIRDDKGTFALSANPTVQKIANDLGLRVPKNYGGVVFDLLDTIAGKQSPLEGTADLFQRAGITGTSTQDSLEISALYQDLERLRNARSLYEQQTGQRLPSIDELIKEGLLTE